MQRPGLLGLVWGGRRRPGVGENRFGRGRMARFPACGSGCGWLFIRPRLHLVPPVDYCLPGNGLSPEASRGRGFVCERDRGESCGRGVPPPHCFPSLLIPPSSQTPSPSFCSGTGCSLWGEEEEVLIPLGVCASVVRECVYRCAERKHAREASPKERHAHAESRVRPYPRNVFCTSTPQKYM